MGDFTEAETRALVAQHTEESGQPFSAAALDAVWTQTRGQPWLVNALCAGACFDNKAGRDRSRAIEADDVRAAREELILSRRTHLDQLAHKLEEARVRRVVEPILSGGEVQHDGRDLEYVRDLGLLAPDSPPRIANPIYAEVVPHHHAAARTKATRTPSGAQGGDVFLPSGHLLCTIFRGSPKRGNSRSRLPRPPAAVGRSRASLRFRTL